MAGQNMSGLKNADNLDWWKIHQEAHWEYWREDQRESSQAVARWRRIRIHLMREHWWDLPKAFEYDALSASVYLSRTHRVCLRRMKQVCFGRTHWVCMRRMIWVCFSRNYWVHLRRTHWVCLRRANWVCFSWMNWVHFWRSHRDYLRRIRAVYFRGTHQMFFRRIRGVCLSMTMNDPLWDSLTVSR